MRVRGAYSLRKWSMDLRPTLPNESARGVLSEKKSLSASERDEASRAAWRVRVRGVDPARWVWVDEFGSHLGLTRTYARSSRGERAAGSAPRNRGQNRTTLTSLSLDSFSAPPDTGGAFECGSPS